MVARTRGRTYIDSMNDDDTTARGSDSAIECRTNDSAGYSRSRSAVIRGNARPRAHARVPQSRPRVNLKLERRENIMHRRSYLPESVNHRSTESRIGRRNAAHRTRAAHTHERERNTTTTATATATRERERKEGLVRRAWRVLNTPLSQLIRRG